MKLPHEKFCILPWISLEASPIGTVRPCCLALDEVTDSDGNKYKLGKVGLEEIRSSAFMTDLRQKFLQGKQPQTCHRCWQEERAGRKSKRMHTLDRLKNVVTDDTWDQDPKRLVFLDLKLGNICNLKCRICGSWSSSSYATEEIAYTHPEERKNSLAYLMNQEGAWPRNEPYFWEDLREIMDDVRYIEFTGGEPFMIKEHFDLLKDLAQRGMSHQIEIHYNTNGTQWPESAPEIWKEFKHVEIAFSIDDVGARFEYQRSNAIWQEVCDNLDRFERLRDESDNITLQVCCTINVFNVRYIDQVAAWIATRKFDFVYWNMLHDAYYFSIGSLPETAKVQISDYLSRADVPSQYRDDVNRAVDFMNNGASLDGSILRMRVKDLDFKRKQRLDAVMPELAACIEYRYE